MSVWPLSAELWIDLPQCLDTRVQVLKINAQTGMPVSSVIRTPGLSTSTDTFQASRVTLANIEAGKF